jgi:DNA-binding winged helix-turn-helix (wHTH) protein
MAPETPTNVLDVYVNYLRRKLGAVSDAPTALIETVRGIGYRMAARPAELHAAAHLGPSHLAAVVNA